MLSTLFWELYFADEQDHRVDENLWLYGELVARGRERNSFVFNFVNNVDLNAYGTDGRIGWLRTEYLVCTP